MKGPFLLLVSLWICAAWAGSPSPLKLERTIPLGDVKGALDHLAVEANQGRLFVAARENNTLEVIDLQEGRRIKSIDGMAGPAGILCLAESNRVLVANPEDATIKILDATSLKQVKTLYSLLDVEHLRWDAKARLVYFGYGNGAIGVLDQAMTTMTRRYKLPTHPESFELESQGTRIFVNVPKTNQVAVLDRSRKSPAEVWPLEGAAENYPMALDNDGQRLFVGCRAPARLLVMDTVGGRKVLDLSIGAQAEAMFYDSVLKRIYITGGTGSITVVQQHSPDKYAVTETVATAEGAKSSCFSPERKELYLAVPARGDRPAGVRVYVPQ